MSFDQIIESKLKSCYTTDLIRVKRNSIDEFELIERLYPIGQNRIEWGDVKYTISKKVDLSDEINAKVQILSFLQEVKEVLNVSDEILILVFGDEAIENVYEMPFYILESNVIDFFGLPQHTYVIPLNGSWCINYTFEDELFFGISNRYSTQNPDCSIKNII